MWLDLADEMGVLVVGSPALECMRLPLSSPYLPARVEREIRETLRAGGAWQGELRNRRADGEIDSTRNDHQRRPHGGRGHDGRLDHH